MIETTEFDEAFNYRKNLDYLIDMMDKLNWSGSGDGYTDVNYVVRQLREVQTMGELIDLFNSEEWYNLG